MASAHRPEAVVFTVGHSTRPLAEFLELLAAHSVSLLVDVRTVPRSRHNPQFNRDTLPAQLALVGIGYAHAAGLGGLRRAGANSLNAGWRNASFRGYADYMQTAEFGESLAWLMEQASRERVAIMCAEAVPWRCHRSLIADALLVHGVQAQELVSAKRASPHKLTPFAQVDGQRITYPPAADTADLDGVFQGSEEPAEVTPMATKNTRTLPQAGAAGPAPTTNPGRSRQRKTQEDAVTLRRAVARWENEGGSDTGQLAASADVASDAEGPVRVKLTEAELVQLQLRVIALENLVTALLADAPPATAELVRAVAANISPRPGATQHHLTVRAAAQMLHLLERAKVLHAESGPHGHEGD